MSSKEQTALVTDAFAEVDDPEWFETLLVAALDQTGGDLAKALEMVRQAIKEHPSPPIEE